MPWLAQRGTAPILAKMGEPSRMATAEIDYASALMVALVVDAVREQAPGLLPAELEGLDPIRQAHTSMDLKRHLLRMAFDELGPAFVFGIGRSIHRIPFSPLLQALLRSRNAEVLLAKWSRFERYGHSLHRTRMERRAPGHYVLEHYATKGPAPGLDHDLFILGVLAAGIETTEPKDLTISLLPGSRRLIDRGTRVAIEESVLEGGAKRWQIHWAVGDDLIEASRVCRTPSTEPLSLSSRACDLLAGDTSQAWSLAETARALGTSARSLQRQLSKEGTSYSSLVRSVRVEAACRLLETTDYSMTEIGYLCGFADAAHFSRDFRASMGANPSQYRAATRDIEQRI